MTPIDRDALARDGWTVVDLLDEHGVALARTLIDELGLPDDHDFFASPAHAWGPTAAEIDRRLREIAGPAVHRHLPDHRLFLSGITSKGRYRGASIKYHHDWTYTDERVHRPTFFWCALVDCDAANGGLSIVTGSHRWTDHVRPSREHEPAEEFQRELHAAATPVSLRAGQAIAFDPATFHGSGPNTSAAARPAFTIAAAPIGAQLLHFHEGSDGRLDGYLVDEPFFTRNDYRTRPQGYLAYAPHTRSVDESDLAHALRPGARR